MKFQHCIILLFLFCCFLSTETDAQDQTNPQVSLVNALVADGFENVGVYQKGKNVYVFFENRRYRWEIDGLSRVLKKAEDSFSDSVDIHLVPMYQRVSVSMVSIAAKSRQTIPREPDIQSTSVPGLVAGMNTDSLGLIRKEVKLQNNSFGRIDLTFLPGLRIQLGNPSQPFEWMISISPILQTSLWKGNLVSIQAMIPLHNELQYQYEGKPRIEAATINQLFRLPGNIFVYGSGGVFGFMNKNGPNNYFQRYGVNGDFRKYFFNGRLGLGMTAGYTGLISFYDRYLHYYPTDTKMNYEIHAEYRNPRFDFTTRLSAGKYLYDDHAVKIEIARQFRELSLAFYLIKSDMKTPGEKGTVGGFAVNIPIAPKKSFKPAAFRVNLAKYFNFEYRLRNADPIATSFHINSDWNYTFRNLNPDFIEKNLPLQR